MPRRMQCPGCGKDLVLSDFTTEPWLTCPRCLAPLPASDAAPAPQGSGPPLPCPSCGGSLPGGSRYCPSCGKEVPWWPGGSGGVALPDRDARNDSSFIGRAMVPLAVVGMAGVGLFVLGLDLPGLGLAKPLLSGAMALALVTAFTLWRQGRIRKPASGIGRVVMGGLALVGAIMGLVLVLGLAGLVYVLVVCSTGNFGNS